MVNFFTAVDDYLTHQGFFWVFAAVLAYFVLRNAVLFGLAWGMILKSEWSHKRRVFRLDYAPGQIRQECVGMVKSLFVDSLIFALVLQVPGVRFAPLTIGNLLFTFVVIFVFFEGWFYATHRALHHPKLYFIHAQHHIARVTTPFSSLSFSAIERATQATGAVVIPVLLARYLGFCLEGIIIYVFVNMVFNVIGHSNTEIYGTDYTESLIGKVGTGVAFHALHHARYNGHYGLFSSVLDRLLGTYFHDYPEVQKRAVLGLGLEKMHERISVGETKTTDIATLLAKNS